VFVVQTTYSSPVIMISFYLNWIYLRLWCAFVRTTRNGEPRDPAVYCATVVGYWSWSRAFRSAHVRLPVSTESPIGTWPLPTGRDRPPTPETRSTATASVRIAAWSGVRCQSARTPVGRQATWAPCTRPPWWTPGKSWQGNIAWAWWLRLLDTTPTWTPNTRGAHSRWTLQSVVSSFCRHHHSSRPVSWLGAHRV